MCWTRTKLWFLGVLDRKGDGTREGRQLRSYHPSFHTGLWRGLQVSPLPGESDEFLKQISTTPIRQMILLMPLLTIILWIIMNHYESLLTILNHYETLLTITKWTWVLQNLTHLVIIFWKRSTKHWELSFGIAQRLLDIKSCATHVQWIGLPSGKLT